MPSRHRPAESSRVTVRPANLTWPEPGDRSPEMRPNRLVLPAPFGPTIPTVSPAPTENDRSSAMTTRPNRFVTWSSSSNAVLIASLSATGLSCWHTPAGSRRLREGRQQVAGDLRLGQQRVVDDLRLERVGGTLLPLDADRRGDHDAGCGVLARGEVHRPG